VKILAFSDLHCDLAQAERLVELSRDADVVIGAGDFASVHSGLTETIDALTAITIPTVLVPGNNETEDALREAVAEWDAATVLHGEAARVAGTEFFGLGAGIPTTPWDWSFDLTDDEAAKRLAAVSPGSIIVLHSPPHGHCDASSSGDHLGSPAITEAIAERAPRLAVCGHIHESWGERSTIGDCEVANLGPAGTFFEV
jgi:Icc-related predicted phosphoesterase